MKTIGMIGGISWKSTATYYRVMNEAAQKRLGGLHAVRCVLWSFDFAEIEERQHRGAWTELTAMMVSAARRLEGAGADFLIICANTMHRMAEEVEAEIGIPLLHIADATAGAIRNAGLRRVGLLGTRFTMEEAFYRARLERLHGLEVLIPGETDRQTVDEVIYRELCAGRVTTQARERYGAVIRRLIEAGAEGIVLGCTEIGMLIGDQDSSVPIFDTTLIHADAAVEFALADG